MILPFDLNRDHLYEHVARLEKRMQLLLEELERNKADECPKYYDGVSQTMHHQRRAQRGRDLKETVAQLQGELAMAKAVVFLMRKAVEQEP